MKSKAATFVGSFPVGMPSRNDSNTTGKRQPYTVSSGQVFVNATILPKRKET